MTVARRMTKQKQIILDVLSKIDTHPTAEYVYDEAKKILPDISLGTVYRNLGQLVENGEINEIITESGHAHYDFRTDPHYHFVCSECGKIYDFDIDPIAPIDTKNQEEKGYCINGYNLWFYGICPNCKKSSSKK